MRLQLIPFVTHYFVLSEYLTWSYITQMLYLLSQCPLPPISQQEETLDVGTLELIIDVSAFFTLTQPPCFWLEFCIDFRSGGVVEGRDW